MPREKRCTRHTCQNRDPLAFCTSRYLFVDARCAKLSGRDTERKFTVEMSEHWRPCFTQSSYNLMSLDDIRHHATRFHKVRMSPRGNTKFDVLTVVMLLKARNQESLRDPGANRNIALSASSNLALEASIISGPISHQLHRPLQVIQFCHTTTESKKREYLLY